MQASQVGQHFNLCPNLSYENGVTIPSFQPACGTI